MTTEKDKARVSDKEIALIEKYADQGVSIVGICSLLYMHGFEGVRHEDLRKIVFKEIQRIDSKKKKTTTMSNDKTAEEIPVWYTYSEMYDRLIRENYSKEIAKELSHKWANDLQGAFSKGYEKAQRHSAQQFKEYREVIRELLPYVENTYKKETEYNGTLAKIDRARKLIDQTDIPKV